MRQKIGPFVLGLSLAGAYILGCATQQVSRPVARAQMPAGAQRWEYSCTAQGNRTADIMARANIEGAAGWEMVAVNSNGDGGIWCFKRPRM